MAALAMTRLDLEETPMALAAATPTALAAMTPTDPVTKSLLSVPAAARTIRRMAHQIPMAKAKAKAPSRMAPATAMSTTSLRVNALRATRVKAFSRR